MYCELVTLIFCDKGFESSRALKKSSFTKFPVGSPVKYAMLRIQSHDRNVYDEMASEDGTGRGVTETTDTVTADADADAAATPASVSVTSLTAPSSDVGFINATVILRKEPF